MKKNFDTYCSFPQLIHVRETVLGKNVWGKNSITFAAVTRYLEPNCIKISVPSAGWLTGTPTKYERHAKRFETWYEDVKLQ